MYYVSAQGVDERMINVRYYYYYRSEDKRQFWRCTHCDQFNITYMKRRRLTRKKKKRVSRQVGGAISNDLLNNIIE